MQDPKFCPACATPLESIELMEDVALVRRIGPSRLSGLPLTVTTSAEWTW